MFQKSQSNEGLNRVDPNSGMTTVNNSPTGQTRYVGQSEGESKNAGQPIATDQPFEMGQPLATDQSIATGRNIVLFFFV